LKKNVCEIESAHRSSNQFQDPDRLRLTAMANQKSADKNIFVEPRNRLIGWVRKQLIAEQ